TSSPSARSSHAIVFDSNRDKVVLFGSWNGSTHLGDTWEYDGTSQTWTEVTPVTSPPARSSHAIVFDSNRGKVVLFGGWNGSTNLDDTWEYDGTSQTWTEVTPTSSPSARSSHAIVFDSNRGKVVLFGGWNGSTNLDDTWEYDGTSQTWTEVTPTSSPSARYAHAMVFDSSRGKIVLFNGFDGTWLGDSWEYDGTNNTWTDIIPVTSPPARISHAMVFDNSRGKVVLFGGRSADWGPPLSDTWEYGSVIVYGYELSFTTLPLTPPSVVATVPVSNATGVAINTTIQVTFDEAMNTSSVEGAFSIAPPEDGSFNWSDNNTVMTFTPADNLTYNKKYFVTIGTAAQDPTASPLEAEYQWTFRTETYSGCFIATAAYGTGTAEKIKILREFRDEVLLTNNLSAEFVACYYRFSPPIAEFISQHDVLRTIVREGIVDPVVATLKWSYGLWSK
ncbi:kelch repeat-containing protein, partial [Chloroflexota bacterium]